MASNQEAVSDVYENLFTTLWRESCGDYINYGMFNDSCKTLTEANEYMIDWIIEKLKITNTSNLLDIACGRGKHTLEIARKTGCRFVGVDIVENQVEGGNKLRDDMEITSQGEFIVGDMLKLSDAVREQKFTHVLALGCLFIVHDKMSDFLDNVKPHLEEGAKVLIYDFSRNVPLEEVQDVMKHWRTTADTLETQDYLSIIASAGLKVDYYSDDTHMALKSCQWVVDVAERVAQSDTDRKNFTFWVLRDAMKARRILRNTLIASIA